MKKIKYDRDISLIIFLLIVLFSFFILFSFSNSIFNHVYSYANKYNVDSLNNFIPPYVNNYLSKIDMEDINWFIIRYNDDGEVISIDINMNNVYEVSNNIYNSLKKEENILSFKNIMWLPFGSILKNSIFYGLGPKLPIKIDNLKAMFVDSYIEVKDYGINSNLVMLYVKLIFTNNIIVPFYDNESKYEYKFLVASKIINGRIPSIYGNDKKE